jgi:flagellar motor switch protein FliN
LEVENVAYNPAMDMLTEAEQALVAALPPTGPALTDLRIELGRTRLPRQQAESLQNGALLALDTLAGEPVDVLADGRLLARGELVVLDGKLAVRVTETGKTIKK